MARYDMPSAELDVAGARIGIVAARFNDDIVSGLLEGALDTLARHGLDRERIPVARVPGAFELPLAARWLAIRYGSLTDTGGLGRPRERRRIVQEAGILGDEPGGKDGAAAVCPPVPAASAGRGRDGASPAAQGRRGRTGPDDARADEDEDGGPTEKPRTVRNVTIPGNATADAVIALGAVVRGETPHFDYVCAEAARGIRAISLEIDVPVVFGVLTCGDHEQANERAGGWPAPSSLGALALMQELEREGRGPERRNKGREAALAALEMVSLRRRLGA